MAIVATVVPILAHFGDLHPHFFVNLRKPLVPIFADFGSIETILENVVTLATIATQLMSPFALYAYT